MRGKTVLYPEGSSYSRPFCGGNTTKAFLRVKFEETPKFSLLYICRLTSPRICIFCSKTEAGSHQRKNKCKYKEYLVCSIPIVWETQQQNEQDIEQQPFYIFYTQSVNQDFILYLHRSFHSIASVTFRDFLIDNFDNVGNPYLCVMCTVLSIDEMWIGMYGLRRTITIRTHLFAFWRMTYWPDSPYQRAA